MRILINIISEHNSIRFSVTPLSQPVNQIPNIHRIVGTINALGYARSAAEINPGEGARSFEVIAGLIKSSAR